MNRRGDPGGALLCHSVLVTLAKPELASDGVPEPESLLQALAMGDWIQLAVRRRLCAIFSPLRVLAHPNAKPPPCVQT